MEQITIKHLNGQTYNLFSNNPYRVVTECIMKREINGDQSVSVKVVSTASIPFELGDVAMIDGEPFTLYELPKIDMISEERYEYSLTLFGMMYDMARCMFRNTDVALVGNTSNFDLTFTIAEFAQVVVNNVNRSLSGGTSEITWRVSGSLPTSTATETISFSNVNCLTALQSICERFDYSWWVKYEKYNGVWYRTLYIGSDKFVGSTSMRLRGFDNLYDYWDFGYGRGFTKVAETPTNEKRNITRLWAEGGSENIIGAYRNYAGKLQLPLNTYSNGTTRRNRHQHYLKSTNQVIQPNTQNIGVSGEDVLYYEDPILKAKYGVYEAYKEFADIYPTHTYKVTSVPTNVTSGGNRVDRKIVVNIGFNLNERWSKTESSNDFAEFCTMRGYKNNFVSSGTTWANWIGTGGAGLNDEAYKSYHDVAKNGNTTKFLIDGTTAKIKMKTGLLAGYSFEISSYDSSTHELVINYFVDESTQSTFPTKPTEDEYTANVEYSTLPFRFAVNDEFVLVDIMMPTDYIEDAEEDLWYATIDEYNKVKAVPVEYKVSIDDVLLSRKYSDVSGSIFEDGRKIRCRFSSLGVTSNVELFIKGVQRDLLKDYGYEITLAETIRRPKEFTDYRRDEDEDLFEGLTDSNNSRRNKENTTNTMREIIGMVDFINGMNDKINKIHGQLNGKTIEDCSGTKCVQVVVNLNYKEDSGYKPSYVNIETNK